MTTIHHHFLSCKEINSIESTDKLLSIVVSMLFEAFFIYILGKHGTINDLLILTLILIFWMSKFPCSMC